MDRIPHTPGIYAIRNLINGHIYVGSAIDIYARTYNHFYQLRHGKHANRHLQSAFNRYGEDSFKIDTLEIVESKEDLVAREQYFIDTLNPEYNIAKKAYSQLGMQHSEETILKMSRPRSSEGRARITEANRKATTYRRKPSYIPPKAPHAPETRKKIAETLAGRKRPPEVVAKVAESRRGKKQRPRSEEAKQRMKEAQILRRERETKEGIKRSPSPETRAKLSAAMKGKTPVNVGNDKPAWNKGVPASEEQKARLRVARSGTKLTSEHKAKISQGLNRHYQSKNNENIQEGNIQQLSLWDDVS